MQQCNANAVMLAVILSTSVPSLVHPTSCSVLSVCDARLTSIANIHSYLHYLVSQSPLCTYDHTYMSCKRAYSSLQSFAIANTEVSSSYLLSITVVLMLYHSFIFYGSVSRFDSKAALMQMPPPSVRPLNSL